MTAPRTDIRLEALDAVDEAWVTWPRGDRPGALRAAATAVRARLREDAPVEAVRTVDLATVPIPGDEALGGVARPLGGPAHATHRLLVVAYEDLDGVRRILAWEPRAVDEAAPGTRERDTVESALGLLGLRVGDVDVVGVSHLHGLDPRLLLGTTMPVGRDRAVRPPLLPDADVLVGRAELDALKALHPLQQAAYRGALHGVREDRLVPLDGSVVVGRGVAVVATPGHTAGHRSLVLRTPAGIWVISGAAHAADAWHPHLSRCPSVRRAVADEAPEVLTGRCAEDAVDAYDAMVLERAVADAHREDPRWRCVLPAVELEPSRRDWPLRGTFAHGGLHVGVLRRPSPGGT